ncbi:MAG: hypothetical protein PHI19_05885, partial [Clostridia bacterium]|nr:hypothetical protein [Clostridia bacterium]
EAVMPEGDHTVFADFRPVPITVGVNDVIATYGDNIRLWANINAYDGVNYSYIWYRDGNEITGQTSNNLQLYDVDESGNYSVRVTSDLEGANTAEDTAIATILPKSVVTQWSEVTVFQYSGTDQYPTATAYDLQSNPLTLLYNGVSHLVGRHTLTVSTTNNNYILSGSTIEYDITPLTTTIVWSNLEFVYDGESHKPTAYAEDVIGNPLNIVVSGAESEASELPYTAHATTADGSYVFANADQEFIVMPEEVSVQWYFQYTDTQKEIFFYNGYDQLMRVQAYFLTIYDYRVDLEVSVIGMTNGDNVFKLPDTYQVTAEFITPAPNYSLSSDSRQLVMQKAKPLISVPQNSFEFVYDGNAHSIVANVLYADTIVYLLHDSEVLNSFIEPGVYAVTLTTREDNLHDKAADVAVTVTVLATTAELKDEEGNIISTLYHANGIDPNAELVCSLQNNITPEMNKNYTDYWGRSVLTLIQLSLDGTEDTTLQGASTVRIQLDETVISNRVLKLRCLQDGKVTELAYTLDEEGYLEFEASLPGEYAIVGTSGTNSIIGISVFVIVGIAIVSSLIVFLVRRKKSVY